LSFYYILGVETVDDLLERIDQAIESAKIVVGNDKDKAAVSKNEGKNAAAPGADNAEKKPTDDEPIRIKYGDIHKIEDLIAAVNNKPGHRKVLLEGAPEQSSTVSVKKSGSPPPDAASPPGGNNENKDSSTTAKTTETPSSTKTEEKTETPNSTTKAKTTETPSSTEKEEKTETPDSTTKAKTTETPSSTKTEEKTETPDSKTKAKTTETPSSTKTEEKTETPSSKTTTTAKTTKNPPPSNDTSESEVDQIHVNIENITSVNDLLDRIDEAVQKVPVVIDTKPRGDKNQDDPKTDKQGDKKDSGAAMKFQKEPEKKQVNDEKNTESF